MAVNCRKDYTLSVNAAEPFVDAYWTMDEIGNSTKRFDRVQCIALVPNSQTGIDSAAGIINGGMAFIETGDLGGSAFDTGLTTKLSITGNLGWSMCMWLKFLNTDVFTANPEIDWTDGVFQFVEIHSQLDSQLVDFLIGDINGNTFHPPNWTYALNTWYFLHVFYDPVAAKVGWSVNLGPPNYAAGPVPLFGEPNSAHVRISSNFHNSPGGTATVAQIVDEVGLKLTRILTPTELAFLYNGGAGNRPPDARTYPAGPFHFDAATIAAVNAITNPFLITFDGVLVKVSTDPDPPEYVDTAYNGFGLINLLGGPCQPWILTLNTTFFYCQCVITNGSMTNPIGPYTVQSSTLAGYPPAFPTLS